MDDQHDASDPVAKSPHARRNLIVTAIVLVLIAVGAWLLTRGGGETQGAGAGGAGAGGGGAPGGGGGARTGRGRPAATVGIAKATAKDMPVTLSAIGTVQPVVVATVRPQLAGTLFTINFTEGQLVAKGQLLAQIDPRPYRLALAQAEANLARDQAQANLARTDLARYRTLLAQDSIARQQVDTQAATAKQTEGIVAADRAAVGTARLNLQYTSITAPVAGRVGLRLSDIGNYVTPGDTAGIVVITQTTPIDVAFAVPQAELPRIVARTRGAPGGAAMPVTATDQGGSTMLGRGRFLTFDNQIDATTGTVKAKARFANPDGKLFPNQFVNVTLLVDTLRAAVIVPVGAVRHGAKGDFVFLLNPDRTVKLQPVTTGPSSGSDIAILSGVQAGQTVITEGADNLDNGSKVTLPGDKPRGGTGQAQGGFFARLFGGGSADQAGAGEGGERRRRRPEQSGGG